VPGSMICPGFSSGLDRSTRDEDPQTGKARQKWYSHRTRGEAERHLAQILTAVQGGEWRPPSRMLLADFLDQWLADYAAGRCGPKTLANYEGIIETHLKRAPELAHTPLAKLEAQTIERYLTGKLQAGMAPSSVGKLLRLSGRC